MLRVIGLETTYHGVILALKGISLHVPPASIVALLGSNGAGKTTTINAISGIRAGLHLSVEDGTIEFEGVPIHDRAPHQIVAMGIVEIPEGRRIFADLTVEENLLVGSYSLRQRKAFATNKESVLAYFPVLRQRWKQRAGYLSGGEQQMLAIARALVAEPRLIMMDEPSLGLAPMLVREIFQIIAGIKEKEKIAILLVEQNANMALSIADAGYVLESGRVVMEGPSETLLRDRDIREFYLGVTESGARKSYREIKHYRRRKRWLS